MKAITYDHYGPFEDVLRLRDIPASEPEDSEVLVRVHAASLGVDVCFSVLGAPYAMRIVTGVLKPKHGIPGFDLAGRVESVGANVTLVKPGDEVFGVYHSTCAEYAVVPEGKLALKPAALTFDEAAAIPTSALAALHGLRDAAKLRTGKRVLVNGASGGVGHFAVQIAKSLGAEVTGVCSTANTEMVRSLGADHTIDYTQEDFTGGDTRYHVILDNVENRSLSDVRRALTPKGTLLLNSGTGTEGFETIIRLAKPLVLSPFAKQNLKRYLSTPNHDDLVVLKEMVEAGKLRPVIDKVYPVEETASALTYIETGHARGKVVVTV